MKEFRQKFDLLLLSTNQATCMDYSTLKQANYYAILYEQESVASGLNCWGDFSESSESVFQSYDDPSAMPSFI